MTATRIQEIPAKSPVNPVNVLQTQFLTKITNIGKKLLIVNPELSVFQEKIQGRINMIIAGEIGSKEELTRLFTQLIQEHNENPFIREFVDLYKMLGLQLYSLYRQLIWLQLAKPLSHIKILNTTIIDRTKQIRAQRETLFGMQGDNLEKVLQYEFEADRLHGLLGQRMQPLQDFIINTAGVLPLRDALNVLNSQLKAVITNNNAETNETELKRLKYETVLLKKKIAHKQKKLTELQTELPTPVPDERIESLGIFIKIGNYIDNEIPKLLYQCNRLVDDLQEINLNQTNIVKSIKSPDEIHRMLDMTPLHKDILENSLYFKSNIKEVILVFEQTRQFILQESKKYTRFIPGKSRDKDNLEQLAGELVFPELIEFNLTTFLNYLHQKIKEFLEEEQKNLTTFAAALKTALHYKEELELNNVKLKAALSGKKLEFRNQEKQFYEHLRFTTMSNCKSDLEELARDNDNLKSQIETLIRPATVTIEEPSIKALKVRVHEPYPEETIYAPALPKETSTNPKPSWWAVVKRYWKAVLFSQLCSMGLGAGGGLVMGLFFAPFSFGLSIPALLLIGALTGGGIGTLVSTMGLTIARSCCYTPKVEYTNISETELPDIKPKNTRWPTAVYTEEDLEGGKNFASKRFDHKLFAGAPVHEQQKQEDKSPPVSPSMGLLRG